MPVFLDQPQGDPTPEMVPGVEQKIKSAKFDEFGAKALNVYWSDSETFCLSEAPNAEAVHKAPSAIGVNLGGGDVRQVQSIV